MGTMTPARSLRRRANPLALPRPPSPSLALPPPFGQGAEDYFLHTRAGKNGTGASVDAYDLHHEEGARCGAGCSKTPDRRGEYR